MKNKRTLIFMIILIVLSISIIVVVINSKNKGNKQEISNFSPHTYEPTFSLVKEKNVANILTINNCANTYLSYIYEKNAEALYEISVEDYIQKNNINKGTILNDIISLNNNCIYNAEDIYEYDNGFTLKTYFTFGKIIDNKEKKTVNFNLVLNIDSKNMTMQISPLEKTYTDYVSILSNNDIKIDEKKFKGIVDEIPSNSYNKANKEIGVGNQKIMQYYFDNYIIEMLYNSEKAYNLLDNNYKQKRFNNYEDFKEFIEENKENIENSKLERYRIEKFANYTEYLCVDNYNNYYIFKETSPMEYTVLLDQYIIDDEIFVEEYKKANNSIKAQLKLNLFQQMLNRKDYDEAYSKLNETFKNEYFSTLNDFKKHIEENFYEYGKLSFEEVTSMDDEYKIKASIVNMKNEEENKIRRFIVELKENGVYNIAFNV